MNPINFASEALGNGRSCVMIKILLFEDNRQFGEGLTMLLNTIDDFKVLGCFNSVDKADREVKTLDPDVVLMDIGFPSGSGIEGVRRIKQTGKDRKVIMLTAMADDETVFEAIKAGADGYVLKKTSPIKLVEFIREAMQGGAPMTPTIARQVLNAFSNVKVNVSNNENLTSREKDVLKVLVNGGSYKEVSGSLNISVDTVRSHIRNIYDKLHVNSKSEAVAKAILNNIV